MSCRTPKPTLTLVAKTLTGFQCNPGQLTGRRLKFDAEDEAQGVFFIANDGTTTRASLIMRNKPAELMFIVPAGLAVGEYTLEVRTSLKQHGRRIGL